MDTVVDISKHSRYLPCFNVAVLFIFAGLCTRTGCDNAQDFQKNSEYTF